MLRVFEVTSWSDIMELQVACIVSLGSVIHGFSFADRVRIGFRLSRYKLVELVTVAGAAETGRPEERHLSGLLSFG